MKELTLQEIHEATLEMMDYIHALCEEHGIVYYVGFGSLIGTVRHNGFIPWDDDFDIQMPRKEFERFREVFEKTDHPAYYRLCERKNTKNYYYGIPRFSDTRYRYVTTNPAEEAFDNGLFIDIYPLDNFGSTRAEAERVKKKVDRLNVMYTYYINRRNPRGGIMNVIQGVSHALLRIRFGNRLPERIDDMVLKTIRKYTSDEDTQIGEVCWDYITSPYPKEWFRERILHDFEGRQYWIPGDYDPLLRFDYGDYMQLPPEEERTGTRHGYKLMKAE